MKRLLILLASAAFVSLYALGQSGVPAASSPSPTPDSSAPAQPGGNAGSEASGVPLPSASAPPAPTMPLIPEIVPETSGKSGKSGKSRKSSEPGAKASPAGTPRDTFGVEAGVRTRVHMRQLQTRAVNEPDIQALWVAAHATKTDPDRRAALTIYYNRLYDRIIKFDPSIKANANIRREAIIARLHYARLGDLPPAEDPYASPTPAAEGPNPPTADQSQL